MKGEILKLLLVGVLIISLFGCLKTYKPVGAEKFQAKLYDGQRISVSGIPQETGRQDYVQPTPLHGGIWRVKISGVVFAQKVNYENEPRIRAMRLTAERARKNKKEVKVEGKVKNGVVDLESFQGIKTDTCWYKTRNPHYSYGYYYNWYPFAYEPNARILSN